MNIFPEILEKESANHRNMEFRNALFKLEEKSINEKNIAHLIRIYSSTKFTELRNQILKLLYDFEFPILLDFFKLAYKKERDLGMKIYALRGLSKFISEKEVSDLLKKFNLTLEKRQKSTPYNYVEYEFLKGKNCLPYLVKKYEYNCFDETLRQVNNQYDKMPNEFKGHFTVNENGEVVNLRKPEESRLMIDSFFNNVNYE